ncbi:MAG: maltose acetyltransferase domain-containing protein [Candidatus Polarisedimenticolia bacterium]
MHEETAEKSKMLAGAWYREDDPVLAAERLRARSLLRRYNVTSEEMAAGS